MHLAQVPPQLEKVSMKIVRAPAAFARPLVQRKLFRPPFKVIDAPAVKPGCQATLRAAGNVFHLHRVLLQRHVTDASPNGLCYHAPRM